jgi:hypothetical protein
VVETRTILKSRLMPKKAVAGALLVASLGCAVVSVYHIAIGVPIDDPWLFPLLVLLPVLLSIGLAFSLRLPAHQQANVLLSLVAVVCSLYLVDGVLEVLPHRPEAISTRGPRSRGTHYDDRTPLQVAADLRAAGIAAYPAFPANTLRLPPLQGGARLTVGGRSILPLALRRNSVIVHCNESGQYALFRSDEWGFNNPAGSWATPVDIAAIGDSFIQGACVDSTETLVANIRRTFPRTVGAGLDGAGSLSKLGLLKEYVARVRPRIVLWFYYEGNDLSDLSAELRVPELRLYLDSGSVQELPEHAAALDSLLAEEYRHYEPRRPTSNAMSTSVGATAAHWVRLNRLRGALALGGVAERMDACCNLDAFRAVLTEARRTVQSWGGRLYVVYLPASGRLQVPLSGVFTDQLRYRGRVLRLLDEMRLPVIDIYPAFRRVPDPSTLFFGVRSHYSPEGYRVAADEIVKRLERADP